MRMRCSANDYMRLSPDEQRQLATAFLSLIESKYPESPFGYDSFPELDCDRMVLSTILSELKESGKIPCAGYMAFRIAG
jgi:hypothetical protein